MNIRARSKDDKEIKRRKLLDAAKELFARQGYMGTTVGQITVKAEESTGTFYLYFNSKTEIYRTLTIEGIRLLRHGIENAISGSRGGSAAAFTDIARAYLRFYREQQDYYSIIAIMHLGQEDFGRDTAMLEAVEKETVEIVRIIEGVLSGGIKDGEFGEVDPSLTTVVLWGMMDGIFLLDQRKVTGILGHNTEALVGAALELIFRGLAKQHR